MMLALLLAAGPVGGPTIDRDLVRIPNAYVVAEHCKDAPYKVVDRFGRPVLQTLDKQPPGALQLAVNRTVNGCPVATVVHGVVQPDQPHPPPEDFQLRRGDGRSHRR